VRRHRGDRSGDRLLLRREREPAAERDRDLDGVVGVEAGFAEALPGLEQPQASTLPDRDSGPSPPAHFTGPTSIPVWAAMKAHMSAYSSITFSVGLPDPWPARVSIRISLGCGPVSAAWSAAMYLKLWPGTTRSSVSAVVAITAG